MEPSDLSDSALVILKHASKYGNYCGNSPSMKKLCELELVIEADAAECLFELTDEGHALVEYLDAVDAKEKGVRFEGIQREVLEEMSEGDLINEVLILSNLFRDRNMGTPSADWRVKGEKDPHGTYYNGERSKLCLGQLTDDQMANAVFMNPHIGNLTGAKERIRWLSRKLEHLIQIQTAWDQLSKKTMVKDEFGNVGVKAVDLEEFGEVVAMANSERNGEMERAS